MQLYQHYLGALYVVTHESTFNVAGNRAQPADAPDVFVSYTRLADGASYVRPFAEFHENIEHEGKTGPRFRFIADPADVMPEGGHP